ncbi:MAG: purine-nucleoside phosphorylase [Candidatus Aerophobetes bacterium]|nr:purine-nucleoside phosphorylase [Candidatus Aerophobetes bacterium]
MSTLLAKIKEAKESIQSKSKIKPKIGIILGTGLGGLTEDIEKKDELPYSNIPHFPLSTAPGHKGNLILGKLSGKQIVAMEGRFHFYEGYSLEEITFPVRVMKSLGIKFLIESNAAGGMNPDFKAGDLMVITDHINLTGNNPLIGPNEEQLGSRFPDMSEPYDKRLIELLRKIALEERIEIHQGVYAGVTGPNFETRAEYRFLRLIGADAVGMSTVPEVIVAQHSNLRVLGISCISDECFPDALKPVDFRKVIQVAKQAEPKMSKLVKRLVEKI